MGAERVHVVLLGHSYLAEENRKQMDALARHVELDVLSPRRWHEGMSHYDFEPSCVERNGWRLHLLTARRFPLLPQSQYTLPGLAGRLRDLKPDLIHVESDPWTTYAVQVIRARNRECRSVPIVVTAKQNTFTRRNRLLDAAKRAVGRRGVRQVSRFIAVSPAVVDIYGRQFQCKADRFDLNTHLGLDTDLFRPGTAAEREQVRGEWFGGSAAPDRFVVGYCGRLVAYKGVEDLLEAVLRLRSEKGVDIHLLLLGDGPLRERLERESGRSPFIRVLPRVPHAEVAAFLRGLDLFVMPSRRLVHHEEHDAHAVMEAMATGLDCVCTDSGVIPEVMAECGTIAPESNPLGLAMAICQYLPGTATWRTSAGGTAARGRTVAEFSLAAVAARNVRTYHGAMEAWQEMA